MWRKFTVYGLRFSKTSFWNRINTGFLDPAVATVLTACGIETIASTIFLVKDMPVATVLTACGIETPHNINTIVAIDKLQQCLPLAVLKLQPLENLPRGGWRSLQQCLPLAVLKPYNAVIYPAQYFGCNSAYRLRY